jgi:hypothetical protein
MMTRIEENTKQNNVSDLESEVEKLKKSLKRKQNKKILTCGSCLLFFILGLILLGVLSVYALAVSGFKEVPFFTKHFYQEPRPSTLVKTENVTAAEKNIATILEKSVKEQALAQKRTDNLKVSLKLSEEQLTALLRDQVTNIDYLNKKIDYIQLAVLPSNLELFSRLKEKNLIVILNIEPKVKNNSLDLSVVNFKIGNLPIPKFIGNLVITNLLENNINKILKSNTGSFQISTISLTVRSVLIEILFKNFKP